MIHLVPRVFDTDLSLNFYACTSSICIPLVILLVTFSTCFFDDPVGDHAGKREKLRKDKNSNLHPIMY
jgi:hypothetical protein